MEKQWRKLKDYFVPSKDNTYRPHLLRRGFLIFFLTVSLVAEGFLVADLVVRSTGGNFLAAVVQSEIIALTNTVRAEGGVGILTEQTQLDAAAQAKARDMATKEYFAHVGPDGREPWEWLTGAGYNYQYAGENLAVRFVDSKDVVSAWMESPSHRANIVKPVYVAVGVGVASGLYQGQPATFVVQYFAAPSVAVSEGRGAPTTAASEVRDAPIPAAFPVEPPGQVKGAEVSSAVAGGSIAQSFLQEVEKQFVRLTSEPRATTQWVLGGIAALMLVTLALTFFVHLQVQPAEMLLGGGAVALFIVSLITINMHFLSTTLSAQHNPASVAVGADGVSFAPGAVVIGQEGASTEQ